MGRARDLANILSSSGSVALDSEMGLSLITPTSITVTGGSGSISSSGVVTFSSATSLALNNVFTSTYLNYKVWINFSCSTNLTLQMRLRNNGTDETGATSYRYAGFRVTAGNSTAISPYSTGNSVWSFGASVSSNYNDYIEITFKAPKASDYTKLLSDQITDENYGSRYIHFGSFLGTNSFDGFNIIPSTGNITGTMSVYGYRN
jgi:hypothetical protein